jgi:hypothetical protein
VATFEELEEPQWDMMMNTNLRSIAFTIKYAMAAMKASATRGSILVTSSNMATGSYAIHGNLIAYSVTKAGADKLVQMAAIEGGPLGTVPAHRFPACMYQLHGTRARLRAPWMLVVDLGTANRHLERTAQQSTLRDRLEPARRP